MIISWRFAGANNNENQDLNISNWAAENSSSFLSQEPTLLLPGQILTQLSVHFSPLWARIDMQKRKG
jgi:hypothetical protein